MDTPAEMGWTTLVRQIFLIPAVCAGQRPPVQDRVESVLLWMYGLCSSNFLVGDVSVPVVPSTVVIYYCPVDWIIAVCNAYVGFGMGIDANGIVVNRPICS